MLGDPGQSFLSCRPKSFVSNTDLWARSEMSYTWTTEMMTQKTLPKMHNSSATESLDRMGNISINKHKKICINTAAFFNGKTP